MSIYCPIGLFSKQEEKIADLIREINQARTAAEKAPWAQELVEVVAVLLACDRYDDKSVHCRLCRNFSELRQKTASLVVKAGRSSR